MWPGICLRTSSAGEAAYHEGSLVFFGGGGRAKEKIEKQTETLRCSGSKAKATAKQQQAWVASNENTAGVTFHLHLAG